ncbi:acyl carrier protein [Murinocardiopsis flavida]|uniref:Acyl carrier protein n=1 Tax=Murinocardiopsis flavida TaxID=645275 RepID=A0A2P8DRZ8_9ACTN|nr:acyl carrier protein [Murinocardiopsis flavida]PSK99989.1 acyl carrier protein [Murinocardiopsis flavida]
MNGDPDPIRRIVLELLELDDSELTENGLFEEDYGADSMMRIEIQAGLEAELDIVIENPEVAEMVNLARVRGAVARGRAAAAESAR